MHFLYNCLGAVLIVVGVGAAIVPAVPGIPLIFGGIWLIAAADHYRHLGLKWLMAVAAVGFVGLCVDLMAGALGAKRVGASKQAVYGALFGTLIGACFGIPGLLLGPFAGAVCGELSAGNGLLKSANVGIGTWMGLLLGTIVKLVASLTMVVLGAGAWWWERAR